MQPPDYICAMGETIYINTSLTKKEKYEQLIPQIVALTAGEDDCIANLANICSAVKGTFNFFWVGFYLIKGEELVLGPFQGSVACTRIAKGKGVCGTAWAKQKTIIVPDVNKFNGHIACSSLSQSEIVVPLIKNNCLIGVLDIDSDKLNDFDDTDAQYLEQLLMLVNIGK